MKEKVCKIEEKGYELERKAHQILYELGYCIFPRLHLFNISYTETVKLNFNEFTDIDVYGIKYDKYLNKTSFIIDCKNTSKGLNKQILSNIGIKDIIKPTFFYMVRSSTIKPEIRTFANKSKIRILHKQFIEENIDPTKNYGSFKKETYYKIADLFTNNDPDGKKLISEILFPIQHKFIINNQYDRLVKSISLFSILKNKEISKKNKTIWEYLNLICFQFLLLNFIEIAKDLINFPVISLRKEILFGLNQELDFKIKMVSYLNSLDKKGKKEKITLDDITPTNSEDIITAIKSIIKNPEHIHKLLLFNDYIIHEYLIHEIRPDPDNLMKMFNVTKSQVKIMTTINRNIINAITFKEKIPPILLDLTQ